MERHSLIHTKLPREFVLLQGTGCRWKKCTFCDYHLDISESPFAVNQSVLSRVTGVYGVLDVINSGSAIELDDATLQEIKRIAIEKGIHTLWFEMHYMYRHHLEKFASFFAPIKVKFRCGVETFDAELRQSWNKGIPSEVTVEDIAKYFQGICLLCCTEGESCDHILKDIELAKSHFEYASVNVFCNNSTKVKQDKALVEWFIQHILPKLKNDNQIEVLINNTDLGVG